MGIRSEILKIIGARHYGCGAHGYRFKCVTQRDVVMNADYIEVSIYLLDKQEDTCLSMVAHISVVQELLLIHDTSSLFPQCKIDKMYFHDPYGVDNLFKGAETLLDAMDAVWSKCDYLHSLKPKTLSLASEESIKDRINYLLKKEFNNKGLTWEFGGAFDRGLILTYDNDESVLWLDFNRLAGNSFTLKQLTCEHGIYGDGMNESIVHDTIMWLLEDNKLIGEIK